MHVRCIIKVFAILFRLKMKYILSLLFVCFIRQASGMAGMDAFLNDLINGQDEGIIPFIVEAIRDIYELEIITYIFKQAMTFTMLKNAQP